jgi:tetratricopeptide (TPR) repeat protein
MRRFGRNAWLAASLAALGTVALAADARAQIGAVPTDQLGTSRAMAQANSPERRAADAYSRGARYQRKAAKESDAKKKQELYEKAKDELTRSLRERETFDAFLALGQVDLALGQPRAALEVCTHAQALKPADEAAKACVSTASEPAPGTPSSSAPSTPPPPPSSSW